MTLGSRRGFIYLPPRGASRVLVSAEHAGKAIPARYGRLGLPRREIDRHIGWDIGADGIVRELRDLTGCPALLGRISRLVVDLNRPVGAPDCIPESSDGTPVPGNRGLDRARREERIRTCHAPFHEEHARLIGRLRPAMLLSVHSFTPRLRDGGRERPWHCAVLYRDARVLGKACLRALRAIGGLKVGDNRPYRIRDDGDYTIPIHGDANAIPAVLVEVRQDLVGTPRGQRTWARHLRAMLAACDGVLGR